LVLVMQSRTIDLAGPVHFVDFGGVGPTVLCLHGLGGSHANWLGVGPILARRARVLALDFAGFGRTPLAGRSATVRANQRLVDRFLEAVIGAPAILIGNSMGGMIALLEAAASPQRVAGLVLVGPSLPRPRGQRLDRAVAAIFTAYALPGIGEWFLSRRRRRLGPEGLVRETLRLCCVDPARVPAEVIAASVVLASERASMPWADSAFLQATRSVLAVLARRRRYLAAIRAVTAPTLLVQGAADRLVPLSAARMAARLRPEWDFEVFADVGHIPQLEACDQFAEAVSRWLDGAGAAATIAASAPARLSPAPGN
jgi:pimeloyl-ACP methyl ester carboxylesterase